MKINPGGVNRLAVLVAWRCQYKQEIAARFFSQDRQARPGRQHKSLITKPSCLPSNHLPEIHLGRARRLR